MSEVGKPSKGLDGFSPATRRWFSHAFSEPSAIQVAGWPHLQQGRHALLLAPTGSGKTLAAFLACIDKLVHSPKREKPGYRVLYVSPLKSLAYDIERNLRIPLSGIVDASETALAEIQVDLRTGDTSANARRKQARTPGDILITTPESLYLLLGSQARAGLSQIETVIVDEIHAVANSKRGTHLFLSLERLDRLCGQDVQRIGLSATQRPLQRIAGLLGGDRSVEIIDCQSPPTLDLTIEMPPTVTKSNDDKEPNAPSGMWPAILPALLKTIRSHTTTLIFCNSRRLTERIAQEINELACEELCKAHHGSVSRTLRKSIEEELKRGELKSLIATSSLELGIDMSSIDLVVQIGSPASVAQGLQRIGRAGHSVGARSQGLIIPKFRGDLLESAVIGRGMISGEVEESTVPRNCLDVLAQQIVAICADRQQDVSDLFELVRRAYPYHSLSIEAFHAVLDMLSGRLTDSEMPQLRPRLLWDRQANTLQARKGAKMISLLNGGTIPDRGLFSVHLGQGGPRIGELDEEMVYEARVGEAFYLGASTWRILEITRDQVVVAPAPGENGKMPFWRGQGPGRPVSLGRAIGAFARTAMSQEESRCQKLLSQEYALSPDAAAHLVSYVREQRQSTGHVPSDRCIVIERFCDEVGDWRVCILSPFGSRVHAPWAMAIAALLSESGVENPQMHWTDDGIALRLPDTGRPPDLALLIPSAEDVRELIVDRLAGSVLFATHFRENASRALLLPRQRPGTRTPLWLQRLKSQQLLDAVQKLPNFPIVVETYRECLQDVFDMSALQTILQEIAEGKIQVESVDTLSPSPFARGLVYSYIAAYLYEGDAPSAERSAQALTLDRTLLRELLGSENLSEFLSADAILAVGTELQCTEPDRFARDADELHDLLRSLGALSISEISSRCTEDAIPWLQELQATTRACRISISGQKKWVAAEDTASYRDGFDVVLPAGIPESLLAPNPDASAELVLRFASKRAPFSEFDVAREFGILPEKAITILTELASLGRVIHQRIRPHLADKEWCHHDVLRRIRRRSLEQLRSQIAPVSGSQYTAFLCHRHGISSPGEGVAALRIAVDMLAGLPLPWSEWESRILPCRVKNYKAWMLDSLCASGEFLWVGCGSLGTKDGKVAIVRRNKAHALLPEIAELPLDAPPLAKQLDEELQVRGASFLVALEFQSAIVPEELSDALAYLVWCGRIVNDTLAFLRGLKSRPRSESAKRKIRMQRQSGRWSSTLPLQPLEPTTEMTFVRSQALLDCFSVVSRELGPRIGGGYAEIAGVFRLMEEQGKLRRGLFVEGLEGIQYSRSVNVDSLRSLSPSGGQILAACDPANPWGSTLSWPSAGASRRAGATLFLWQGSPVCFLESGRTKLLTFVRDDRLDQVLRHLLPVLAKERTLRVTRIDGEAASRSVLAPRFKEEEWRIEQSALVLEKYR